MNFAASHMKKYWTVDFLKPFYWETEKWGHAWSATLKESYVMKNSINWAEIFCGCRHKWVLPIKQFSARNVKQLDFGGQFNRTKKWTTLAHRPVIADTPVDQHRQQSLKIQTGSIYGVLTLYRLSWKLEKTFWWQPTKCVSLHFLI
jgi:hypothetical protein